MTNASRTHLSATQKGLKTYQAMNKFKKVSMGIMAKHRLTKALEELRLGDKK